MGCVTRCGRCIETSIEGCGIPLGSDGEVAARRVAPSSTSSRLLHQVEARAASTRVHTVYTELRHTRHHASARSGQNGPSPQMAAHQADCGAFGGPVSAVLNPPGSRDPCGFDPRPGHRSCSVSPAHERITPRRRCHTGGA